MSLRIIDDLCRIENGKLIVVMEGKLPDIVTSPQAKILAIKKAEQCGFSRIGINGQSGSYPVDKNGKTADSTGKEWDWNAMAINGEIAAYRNDIFLMNGL